ncbi:hypothetical protein ACFQL0_13930 [Haloplanus litoreus]|uniref:hypothetical protein n=1 Tax=Haloplanus litoreus TaxID=767515 RepID=UPI00360EB58F
MEPDGRERRDEARHRRDAEGDAVAHDGVHAGAVEHLSRPVGVEDAAQNGGKDRRTEIAEAVDDAGDGTRNRGGVTLLSDGEDEGDAAVGEEREEEDGRDDGERGTRTRAA